MPLFQIEGQTVSLVRPTNFTVERQIQALIERNLVTVFDCRLVASEFPTGQQHAGRIDTLALSEEGNPVIIEYKKVESSELVNQSLYYLSWLNDHRGDFQVAADKHFGKPTDVDWTDIRVICIAPGYKKFDLHAVQMMGANIELWQYRLFQNDSLYLEEVFRRRTSLTSDREPALPKNPIMVSAGKKAALTRSTGSYTFDEHLEGVAQGMKEIAEALREFLLDLDESVEESPKKFYVAYKVAQNFVCMEVQKNKIVLFLKLDPAELQPLAANMRDVRNIGHYGTGNLEMTVRSMPDVEAARDLIKRSYERVGG